MKIKDESRTLLIKLAFTFYDNSFPLSSGMVEILRLVSPLPACVVLSEAEEIDAMNIDVI